jgi:hypothetical protein
MRNHFRSIVALLATSSAMLPAARSAQLLAQDTGRQQKSVYGQLELVNKPKSGVIMRTNDGERMAWRFDAAVVAEIAKLKEGAPMIVIYRQTASNEKRVTAVAFPGTADKPTYVNMTRESVVLRSAPFTDGACNPPGDPISESVIPAGGRAEALEACWCCAPNGAACTPTNKTGVGRALLTACFF